MAEAEYNPLDYGNLTRNVVQELMRRGPYPLPPTGRVRPTEKFPGAGVYALFYDGDFEPYGPVRSPDATRPMYVGKAVPEGARTGRVAGGSKPGAPLFERLKKHAGSIGGTENLRVSDFRCRYLVVTPLWITMAEQLLIRELQPLWNTCIEGFGIHDPGRGRQAGKISWWDALHPGRGFAARLNRSRSEQDALVRLEECLKAHPVSHERLFEPGDTAAAEAAATLGEDAAG